jgi:ABC-type polysaccharide/polyol phosphate transport system ATPase subunit
MSATIATPRPALTEASLELRNAGVRFDFDARGRIVTPGVSWIRRVRQSHWGLRGIDLQIAPGTGLAVVGPTGSGKTTLLRLLSGVLIPDEGSASWWGRVGALLATEAGLQAMLTGREAATVLSVLAGLSIEQTNEAMETIKDRSRLEDAFDRPVYTYSQGMRARLHLAVIQASDPSILLLDEIFEALDHEFRKIVEDYGHEVRVRGGIVVAAGHDHTALERLCPEAAWIDDGSLRAHGPFAEVISNYRAA